MLVKSCSRRPGSAYGRGPSRTALTMLNIAVLAPMPSASAMTATAVSAGAFKSVRTPNRKSCSRIDMVSLKTRLRDSRVSGSVRPKPRRRGSDVRHVELGQRLDAEQLHRAHHVGLQNLARARDPFFTGRSEAIDIGSPGQHSASAETERLDDVAATPDAPVHQNLDAAADGVPDFGQNAQARGD